MAIIYLGCLSPDTSSGTTFERNWKKTNLSSSDLAPNRGLPSQRLTTLLVRSYRTFAPLPLTVLSEDFTLKRRYVSVALSSRLLALGVTQQVWSFGSPDFPQTRERVRNRLRLLFIPFPYYCNCSPIAFSHWLN
jgi:hypothetical protein